MSRITDIAYGNDPLQTYDLYTPDSLSDRYRTIIHIHGGSLSGGTKKPHPYIDDLVLYGYVFADVNYRLLPAVTVNDILSDCAHAVKKIIDHLPEEKKRGKIFLAGDSAGGYIVMMLLFRRDLLEKAGVPYDAIGGFLLDDPMFLPNFEEFSKKENYITDLLCDPACPISYIEKNAPYPPMYFLTYGKSIHGFPEFTHLAVATLFRFGYGDRVKFSFFPDYPHCGNFEAPPIDGVNAYSHYSHKFYTSVKD